MGQEWGPSGRLWGCPIARGTLELLCPTDLQLRPTASASHRPMAVGQLCPIVAMLCPIAVMLCPIAVVLCPIAVGQLCPIAMMLCPIAAMLCPIAAMLCPIAVVL